MIVDLQPPNEPRASVATRDAFGKALLALGEENESVVVLSGDLAESTRAQLFGERFPNRFFEMGISEQDLMGTAAGMALHGKIPFVCTYAAFGTGRAYDQVRISISYTGANVKIALTHAGLSVGEDGASAQTLEDIALMVALSGMTVLVPADANETFSAVKAAAAHQGPVYLRLGRSGTPLLDIPDADWQIGKVREMRSGTDVTVVACGSMVALALDAAEICALQDISVQVINMHTIKPVDEAGLIASARHTGKVVVAEEHSIFGGLGSIVARVLAQNCPVPMRFIAVRDSFGESGTPEQLMQKHGLTATDIVQAVSELV